MNSMTGYGRATTSLGTYTLTVQVSSVNRKTLDLTVALPDEWESLEPAIGEQVRKVAVRGKVHVDLELTGAKGAGENFWDENAAGEALARLAAFAKKQGLPFQPTPELLWQVTNSQRKGAERPPGGRGASRGRTGSRRGPEKLCRDARPGRRDVAEGFSCAPGPADETDRGNRHAFPRGPVHYREQLLRRLREAGLELDVNDERVLKEVALFADRCDISEELTRLRSHFEQFTALLKSGGEIGRKSEFILQEISREVHTIGSKANDLTISRGVIELKNELERVREQIANVE